MGRRSGGLREPPREHCDPLTGHFLMVLGAARYMSTVLAALSNASTAGRHRLQRRVVPQRVPGARVR